MGGSAEGTADSDVGSPGSSGSTPTRPPRCSHRDVGKRAHAGDAPLHQPRATSEGAPRPAALARGREDRAGPLGSSRRLGPAPGPGPRGRRLPPGKPEVPGAAEATLQRPGRWSTLPPRDTLSLCPHVLGLITALSEAPENQGTRRVPSPARPISATSPWTQVRAHGAETARPACSQSPPPTPLRGPAYRLVPPTPRADPGPRANRHNGRKGHRPRTAAPGHRGPGEVGDGRAGGLGPRDPAAGQRPRPPARLDTKNEPDTDGAPQGDARHTTSSSRGPQVSRAAGIPQPRKARLGVKRGRDPPALPAANTHRPGLFRQRVSGTSRKVSGGKGSDHRTRLLRTEHPLCARRLAGIAAVPPTTVLGGRAPVPPDRRGHRGWGTRRSRHGLALPPHEPRPPAGGRGGTPQCTGPCRPVRPHCRAEAWRPGEWGHRGRQGPR